MKQTSKETYKQQLERLAAMLRENGDMGYTIKIFKLTPNGKWHLRVNGSAMWDADTREELEMDVLKAMFLNGVSLI